MKTLLLLVAVLSVTFAAEKTWSTHTQADCDAYLTKSKLKTDAEIAALPCKGDLVGLTWAE